MARPLNLLFVCTANVCRSPLAAGLMAYNAKQFGARVNVASGGTDREVRPTHPTTIRMLADRGVTLGRTHSQHLNDELVRGADLVLGMTSDHAKSIVGRYPASLRKVFVLEHLVTEVSSIEETLSTDVWLTRIRGRPRDYSTLDKWDIPDPIGESEAIYEAVRERIDNATSWLGYVLANRHDPEPSR